MNRFDDHLDEITFTDYLDGTLAPDALVAVESHLDICATCAAQVAEFRALFIALDDVPDLVPSRDLAPAVVAALPPAVQPLYRPRPLRRVLGIQIAAVILLSLVAGYVLLPQWMVLQHTLRFAWSAPDFMPLLLWAQALWDTWVAPLQSWRGVDPAVWELLPALSLSNAAALFVLTVIGWVLCNRFLLPNGSLTTFRRTP